ncbi:TOTE conflict system archaeo-eukaryotic primase domain-containing protein [Nannocystis pusilla]|uniref:TOTE conflict system archaeo-eukaryotic primase domain-containing protein n=1 Tax=Nannocystis pusilla TaxID=889268 RepID=UPI003BF1AD75
MSQGPNPLYSALAERLLALFFVRKDTYAIQSVDGYQRLKKPISKRKIGLMLSSGESLLAYQFENNLTSWVCLDFDVAKTALDAVGELERSTLIQKIFGTVRIVAEYLTKKQVSHLVEFSGNRGFHIWILFSDKATRIQSYLLINHILKQTGMSQKAGELVIDLFPATPTSGAKYGKGVKLPLSRHKKSKAYSYFIFPISEFSISDNMWRTQTSNAFLASQLEILNATSRESFAEVSRKLDFAPPNMDGSAPRYLRKNVNLANTGIDLDLVKSKLAQCAIVDELFKRAASQERLSEKERLPIVGLLNRIRTSSRPDLGQDLATQFFSSLPGFDENKTRSKLASLRLYPPTCAHLKDLFPDISCACAGVLIRSPSDFLIPLMPEGEREDLSSPFDLSRDDALSVLVAEKVYTKANDEVAVMQTRRELESMDTTTAHSICRFRSTDSWPPVEFFRHERIEELDSRRILFSLSARDKVWSTGAILSLNRVYALEFSDHSYGYRVQPFFQGGNIFKQWLSQWKLFTGRLSGYIYRRESVDCWLIKIDIRSFYSSIDLDRLETKLLHGPTRHIEEMLRAMPPEHVAKYRWICTELMRLCRIVMQGAPGVPQGPAFARYLAEVFLMEFDRQMEGMVEDGVIFYSRYVDDIFIVVDSDADPKPIERIATDALSRLGLEQNTSKHYSGPIEQFRGQFMKYRNDAKYLVDQVSRRFESSSGEEIRDAADKLRQLVEGEFGEGVQNEHLSFLYTHLEDDADADNLRRKYEEHLVTLQEGRGALFSNFYSYFLRDPQRLSDGLEPLKSLTGLRRQVLINALSTVLVAGSASDATIEVIKVLFSAYLNSQEIETVDVDYVLCAALAEPRVCPEKLFDLATDQQIVRALRYPIRKTLPPYILGRVRQAIIGLPMYAFIGTLSEIVFSNDVEAATLFELTNLFVSRAMVEIRDVRPELQSLDFLLESKSASEAIPKKYYDLVCLASSVQPDRSQAELEGLWRSMVRTFDKIHGFEHGPPTWLRRVSEETTSLANINAVLMSKVDDGFCRGVPDRHSLFAIYHDYLAVFTLLPSSAWGNGDLVSPFDSGMNDLRHRLKTDPNPFIRWILDEPPARFYPNRVECLENTLKNDIMQLYRDGKILVRLRNDFSSHPIFSVCSHERFSENFMNSKFMSLMIDARVPGYEQIKAKLDQCGSLVEFANMVVEIYTATVRFANACGEQTRCGNIFAEDARISTATGSLLVPYSLLGPALVWSDSGGVKSRVNNMGSLIQGCLDVVRRCSLRILPPLHPLSLDGAALVTQLNAFDDLKDKWAFLTNLGESLARIKTNVTAYDIEFCRVLSILNVLKQRLSQGARLAPIPLSVTEAFFQHYLKIKRPPEHYLMLDVAGSPSRETLRDFYMSLISSIRRFFDGFEYSFLSFDIADTLMQESEKVIRAAYTLLGAQASRDGLRLEEFTQMAFSVDKEAGELKIGEDVLAGSMVDDTFALHVTSGEFVFTPWREYIAQNNPGGKTAYVLHAYGRWFLVFIGGALLAAFERLLDRHKRWARYCGSTESKYTNHLFFKNSRKAELSIRDIPGFASAVEVVKENRLYETAEAEQLVASWVARFAPEYHDTLVQVIGAHAVVKRSDASDLVRALKLRCHPETVFFSLKRLEDVNGTHRLLYKADGGLHLIRKLQLEDVVSRIVAVGKEDSDSKRLVIFADVCISGSQICNALENHYLDPRWNAEKAEGALLHPIPLDFREMFSRGLRRMKEIEFVFAVYTDEGRKRLVSTLNNFGISEERIRFVGREIDFCQTCVTGNPSLLMRTQKQFLELIQDGELIGGMFKNGTSDKNAERINLVARQLSVPKLGAKLFILDPRDYGIPLFEHIREH